MKSNPNLIKRVTRKYKTNAQPILTSPPEILFHSSPSIVQKNDKKHCCQTSSPILFAHSKGKPKSITPFTPPPHIDHNSLARLFLNIHGFLHVKLIMTLDIDNLELVLTLSATRIRIHIFHGNQNVTAWMIHIPIRNILVSRVEISYSRASPGEKPLWTTSRIGYVFGIYRYWKISSESLNRPTFLWHSDVQRKVSSSKSKCHVLCPFLFRSVLLADNQALTFS